MEFWKGPMGELSFNADPSPWFKGRRVFVTGHTGFTGAWLCHWLLTAGAQVHGYALAPPTDQDLNLFANSGLNDRMVSVIGDIRDRNALNAAMAEAEPEVVFHLAAQALVRLSTRKPEETYETNVIGTLNVLRAAQAAGAAYAVNITSDKAYENNEWVWGYRENDRLGGHDIYSSSKSCADILARAFWLSFCQEDGAMRLATCRAGNVIGGGDWAEDRLVADIARAYRRGETVVIRRPEAVRPWQHILECVRGYLRAATALADGRLNGGAVNFGPGPENAAPVGELTRRMFAAFGDGKLKLEICPESSTVHEANLLRLDITRARVELGWSPVLDFAETVDMTARFYKSLIVAPGRARDLLEADIAAYSAKLGT